MVSGLTTPVVGADYLDYLAPLRHGGELRGRVLSVLRQTPDAVTLTVRPGRDWPGHVPGQHARVGVEVNGVRLWRTYSITSAPLRGDESGAQLEFTVKAVPGGAVSTRLTEHTAPGDLLFLGEALGDFVLPSATPAQLSAPLLFVAGGSGVTPVIAMLRATTTDRDIVVVASARTATEAIYGAELRALADAGRITLIERFTATAARLSGDDLFTLVPDAAARLGFVCGPSGLVESVETAWQRAGISSQLRSETFHTPVVATGEGGTAEFITSGVTVTAAPGQSLLDAGEAAGLLLPSGCRQGLCFGCVRPLVSGAVHDLRTGELTYAEAGDGVSIQTCISSAAGACQIEG